MKAWILRGDGAAGLEDVAAPEPGPGEVRIRMAAAALNHHDVFARLGLKGPGIRERSYPYVSGSDGAGYVDALGAGVTGFAEGQPVAVYPGIGCGECEYCRAGREPLCRRYRSWSEGPWGALAEFSIAPARNLMALPFGTELTRIGAGIVTYTTAWHLLVVLGGWRLGQTGLGVGGGGGVAAAGVTIAVRAGARVFATSGQEWKVLRLGELGAIAVDHSAVEYDAWILEQTEGRGADLVLDSNGAATWRRSIRSLAPGGRMVVCGATTGDVPEISIRELYQSHRQILGSPIGGRSDFDAVIPLLVSGELSPVIHSIRPLEEVEAAMDELEAGGQFGKIVLRMGGVG